MPLASRLRRGTFVALLAAVALLAPGCPRQPDAPDPGMGEPCETMADCNDADCGLLRLCVDNFCEESATLVRPCEGAGDRVPED